MPHEYDLWAKIDVTGLVRDWDNGAYPNYGMMLRGPEVSGADARWRALATRAESDADIRFSMR